MGRPIALACRLVLAAAALCGGGRRTAAQDAAPAPAPPVVIFEAEPEVRDYLHRADEAASAGSWVEACHLYAELLDRSRTDDGRAELLRDETSDRTLGVGLRRAVAGRLFALPEEGRARWEAAVGPEAIERAVAAADRLDDAALLDAATRFPRTEGGRLAAGALGRLAIERGDAALFDTASRLGAEPASPAPFDLVRLAALRLAAGDRAGGRDLARAAAALPPGDPVLFDGVAMTAPEAAAEILGRVARRCPAPLPLPPALDPAARLRLDLPARPEGGGAGPDALLATGGGWIVAYRAGWFLAVGPRGEAMAMAPAGESLGLPVAEPLIERDRLILTLYRPEAFPGTPQDIDSGGRVPRGEVASVALAGPGAPRVVWRSTALGSGEPWDGFFENSTAVSNPVSCGSRIVAVFFTSQGEYDAVGLDGQTGRPAFRLRLAAAPGPAASDPKARQAWIVADGARAYAVLDVGVVAAIEAVTGEILWVRAFPPRSPLVPPPHGTTPRLLRPPTGEVLVVAELTGSRGLVGIGPSDGALRWEAEVSEARSPVREVLALETGAAVAITRDGLALAIDPATGRRIARPLALPGRPAGGGAATGNSVLVGLTARAGESFPGEGGGEGSPDGARAALAAIRLLPDAPPRLDLLGMAPIERDDAGHVAVTDAAVALLSDRRLTIYRIVR